MITGDKTTVDIDGAIALLGTEFTNNINEILTDVKAVLEKEEVTFQPELLLKGFCTPFMSTQPFHFPSIQFTPLLKVCTTVVRDHILRLLG